MLTYFTAVEEPKIVCKGIVYKCEITRYINKKGQYVEKMIMALQKRLSCQGCSPQCQLHRADGVSESIDMGKFPILRNPENGAYYGIHAVNMHRDWESGQVDDYDWEFYKLKEQP